MSAESTACSHTLYSTIISLEERMTCFHLWLSQKVLVRLLIGCGLQTGYHGTKNGNKAIEHIKHDLNIGLQYGVSPMVSS